MYVCMYIYIYIYIYTYVHPGLLKSPQPKVTSKIVTPEPQSEPQTASLDKCEINRIIS